MKQFILKLSCRDRLGIVAAVSCYLAEAGCNIIDAQQFDDRCFDHFFMRVVLDAGEISETELRRGFEPIAREFSMSWTLRDRSQPMKVLIMVSKFDHCLLDLLYRQNIGELSMNVVGVVSNHPRRAEDPRAIFGIPYHHLPISPETKRAQETKVLELIEESGAELVVLARYMQILSPQFVERLEGRCINIHHSFLPGFKGARPYHQAFERGVKMIGATSHYVTSDLDEGPIIAQDTKPISHRHSAEELVTIGRDVERRVLASAVKAHIEERVFQYQNRTVVLE